MASIVSETTVTTSATPVTSFTNKTTTPHVKVTATTSKTTAIPVGTIASTIAPTAMSTVTTSSTTTIVSSTSEYSTPGIYTCNSYCEHFSDIVVNGF